jgi:putative NADH-flavin reductase
VASVIGPSTITSPRVTTFLKANGVTGLLDPADKPKYDEKDVCAYNLDQVTKLFAATTANERLLFEFFLGTGFREQEVMYSTWANVDFAAKVLRRGHHVRAIVRSQNNTSSKSGLDVANSDLSDVAQLAEVLKGVDAVVSAYRPPVDDNDQIIGTTKRITEAVKKNKQRLLVVGGAGGLFVAPGVTAIASGHLPEFVLPIAKAHEQVRQNLEVGGADWTYFAPAGLFEPGERIGKFRLGKDDLIVDSSGNSRISMEDYAIAAVDELERPKHRGARFTTRWPRR